MLTTCTSWPEIAGTFGVDTSLRWPATAVGMAVLERGRRGDGRL